MADALGRIWLNNQLSESQAGLLAAALVQAQDCPPPSCHLHALSLAFSAVRKAFMRPAGDHDVPQATEELLREVRALGCERATVLAEVAWSLPRILDSQHAPRIQALRQRWSQPSPAPEADASQPPPGPALERVWRDTLLCVLHGIAGDFERALTYGLSASRLAQEAQHAFTSLMVVQCVVFPYLSVGDVETAEALLTEGLAHQRQCGFDQQGLLVNLLLALALGGRFEEAAGLLDSDLAHDLLSRDKSAAWPLAQTLLARVRLAQGRAEEAAQLPVAHWSPESLEQSTVAANRLWICADVLTGLGRPEQARAHLQAGLQAFEQAGVKLLPMNSTQLHRALADACEATGDLPAALAALRLSQAHCYTWVGQSLRLRMQMLHEAAANREELSTQRRQQERLAQMERTLQAAQAAQEDASPGQDVLAAPQGGHRLLARVTHEVRNPLHGVVWMTSLLMMSDLDARQREYLTLANSSARMALELCNDVLDLARIDAGKLELKTEALDLGALLAECSGLYEPAAQAKGLALRFHGRPALPPLVLGDRLRLQQVLMNLLSNAIKFTHTGSIDVHASWLGESLQPQTARTPTVRLCVTDTGPGLPGELLPRLFQEFEQAAGSEAVGGTGLGLALCRQLVRLMGGEIGVDNLPGLGCTFWCLLPLPRA